MSPGGARRLADGAPGGVPPLVLNTALLGPLPMETKYDLAVAQGFAGVEVWLHEVAPQLLGDDDADELERRFAIRLDGGPVDKEALAERGRRLGFVVDGLIPGPDVLLRWSDRLDDSLVARLTRTMEVCAMLGARYLVLPAIAATGSRRTIAASLAELAPIARGHGLRLGLEPIGQSPLMPTVADALAVLDLSRLDVDSAGIILDTFHFFRAGQTVGDLAPLCPERIAAVQINDALNLPLNTLLGSRHRDYPGRGIFDVTAFCAAVLECGWRGPFAVEVLNPELLAQPPADTCRDAFATGSKTLREAMERVAPTASASAA